MKFFHLGDLHLGKSVYDVNMAKPGGDQEYWIDRFIEKVDEYQPDAVVMAGDIYDRKIPSPEAVVLLNRLLTALTDRGKYVFVVPGNHDSAVRLSFAADLLQNQKIYIAGELARELLNITVPGEPSVTVWLMPYFYPKQASDETILNRDDLISYDQAVRELLKLQHMDESSCNILVAHQNVMANGQAPEHTKSETVIGTVGEIDASAFDAFDYVALGHIHCAQKVGRETVRYAGCPLYYDFTECNRNKALTMVTVNSKSDIQIERIDIPLQHKMIQLRGTFDEVLMQGVNMENKQDYYMQAVLNRQSIPAHAKDKLRDVYGETLISVVPDRDTEYTGLSRNVPGEARLEVPIDTLFADFYHQIEDVYLDEKQCEVIGLIRDQQSRNDGEYVQNAENVDQNDVQEIIDFLMDHAKEAEV